MSILQSNLQRKSVIKKNNYGEPEITHQHHSVDDCKVCHFSFGSYLAPKVIAYKLIPILIRTLFYKLQRNLIPQEVCTRIEDHQLFYFQ
jgi:hypothetical protein